MASKSHVTARFDDATLEAIEAYEDARDCDNRTEAIEELVAVGLREQSNPLLYRAKDRVVDWMSLLGFSAVIVFLAGHLTDVFDPRSAMVFSVALVILAVVLLAVFELARVALAMNEIGARARTIFGREA